MYLVPVVPSGNVLVWPDGDNKGHPGSFLLVLSIVC
jgi:hypothetical protein